MVPFNGAALAVNSTIAGHTPIAFTALPPAIDQHPGGQAARARGAAHKRVAGLPDVPTNGEAGVPDLEGDTLTGLVAPAGTPEGGDRPLNAEIEKLVALPDVKEKLAALGFGPVADTPAEFGARIKSEIAQVGKVVRDANIKIELKVEEGNKGRLWIVPVRSLPRSLSAGVIGIPTAGEDHQPFRAGGWPISPGRPLARSCRSGSGSSSTSRISPAPAATWAWARGQRRWRRHHPAVVIEHRRQSEPLNKVPYDIDNDFIPVTKAGGSPNSWTGQSELPGKHDEGPDRPDQARARQA